MCTLNDSGRQGTVGSEVATPSVAVEGSEEHRFMEGAPSAFTHLMKSEYELPVEDGSYDVILSGQVMEHVRHIWRWMPELARACRPGGHVITIAPVSWPRGSLVRVKLRFW